MVDQGTTAFFNRIYDETYDRTCAYVTSKCGQTSDIADILQETYTEVYSVMVRKGPDYIENAGAFVLQVAKTKIHRHYTLAEKLRKIIPSIFRNEEDEEVSLLDLEASSFQVDDEVVNRSLTEGIWKIVNGKEEATRKVFYLYYSLGLTIPEVAKELSMTPSGVKNRLYRTVKEIRSIYTQGGDSDE